MGILFHWTEFFFLGQKNSDQIKASIFITYHHWTEEKELSKSDLSCLTSDLCLMIFIGAHKPKS